MINLVTSNKVKVGDEFYSPIYGRKIGVVAINDKGHIYFGGMWLNSFGQRLNQKDGELLIFPSKDNRDWGSEFIPGQKVLVKNKEDVFWAEREYVSTKDSLHRVKNYKMSSAGSVIVFETYEDIKPHDKLI